MKTDEQVVEEVAMRLDGKKLYRVWASETVYYCQKVWAYNEDDAAEQALPEEWGDPVDSQYFEVIDTELIEQE